MKVESFAASARQRRMSNRLQPSHNSAQAQASEVSAGVKLDQARC